MSEASSWKFSSVRKSTDLKMANSKILTTLMVLLGSTMATEHQKYSVDHTYYTMSLYKNNADGMYDQHFVDMSTAHNQEFLSESSQGAEKVEPGFIFPFYGHLSFYCTSTAFCPPIIRFFLPSLSMLKRLLQLFHTKKRTFKTRAN